MFFKQIKDFKRFHAKYRFLKVLKVLGGPVSRIKQGISVFPRFIKWFNFMSK